MQIDFNDSVLFISARSPFARRVRLAFLENGIRFEERIVDVFHPTAELLEKNPLARVPTLVLKSGKVVIDSNLILQLLYETIQSPLTTTSPEDRLSCSHWSALAYGMSEKIVEYYLETLRPEAAQDQELFDETRGIFRRVLERFEAFIGERDFVAAGKLTQADLDMGTALTYLSLRSPDKWTARYPSTSRYLHKLQERPSFIKTQPPAA